MNKTIVIGGVVVVGGLLAWHLLNKAKETKAIQDAKAKELTTPTANTKLPTTATPPIASIAAGEPSPVPGVEVNVPTGFAYQDTMYGDPGKDLTRATILGQTV